jgi:hypothetical protein
MQHPPHIPGLYCIPSRLICTWALHKTMHPIPRRVISGKMMGEAGSPGLSAGPNLFMGDGSCHNIQPYACLTFRQPDDSLAWSQEILGANRFRTPSSRVSIHALVPCNPAREMELHSPTANNQDSFAHDSSYKTKDTGSFIPQLSLHPAIEQGEEHRRTTLMRRGYRWVNFGPVKTL